MICAHIERRPVEGGLIETHIVLEDKVPDLSKIKERLYALFDDPDIYIQYRRFDLIEESNI